MSNLSTLFDRYKALVVFDTETSGLDFDNDQIIELAALRVERTATGGLRISGKMDTFIKLPEGETLPENIVSLTGITDERLQTEGVQPVKAAGQIAKLMQDGPTLMIAHNAQFDACFLRGLLRGQKVGLIDWLDSLTVYKDRRAYPHKLANAIIAYDLTGKVQNSHRAIDDVLALFEVLKAMDDEREDLGSYRDEGTNAYGSAEAVNGGLTGTFAAPNGGDKVLRRILPFRMTDQSEADRFAKGLLRDANKNATVGTLWTGSLLRDYAAGSVVTLATEGVKSWDGTAFISRIRHDYVKTRSKLYLRKPLEGY